MKSRRHWKHRSPKGKEPAESNMIDLSEPPVKNVPQSNASSSRRESQNDTNMTNELTITGANTIPLGAGSPAGRAGAPPKTPNPFSPSSLSIGPRPKRGWQPHLPLFSSDDFEPPRTGENPSANNNGNNAQTQITTARNEGITTPQTPQDAPRRSFTIIQKCKVLETCLSIKDEYLSMPPAFHHDQEPFWSKILNEKLSPDLVFKFKVWKDIKESVEHWCYARRTLLREGNLPPVSPAQPELDTLIDQWNTVFVTRFCQVHRGYFENGLWAMNENRVSWMVSEHVDKSISSMLQTRRDELESSVRPRLLANNSSLTEYDNAVKIIQDGFTISRREHTQRMESEAVLSMIMELRPVLEKAISQHFNGARQTHQERSSGPHTEPAIPMEPVASRGGPRSNDTQRLTIPSFGHSASASSTPQHPITRVVPSPMASSNQRSLPESNENELRRKRKSAEPVPRITPTHNSTHLGPGTPNNYDNRNLSNNQPKRPRLDSGISSDVSPRIGSREEASRPQQRQLSPLRRPPASRTPGRPSSPPTQERQSRPAGSFPRGHDSQYPDKWVGDGEPHRPCQPRGFREDTVEFDNMSTRRQNQLIRTQNRTLLEKLEELGPRSERGPRNNHDSYHRP
ncbi:hypothetical protein NOF04DRAFT_11160 [Fusarium oxysporum II5]|uniref:Uncharacterized protein n=2 Tax=Fusarium oxysporum species complex TaxID=171631 RepID=X0J1D4_FUSO5|nr:uncharacterized protein FOIG_12440 [Fusarium odoratissimum NRRL 54006]EXL94998.1 hypothetical protein FOIG_12440 [Fusarium odoratissimum NRRL 54006]KAK2135869.1 hypothetical protein NOF04DRAFT_11160 [Fusarium oxysporum II5]TXC12350.1 hypothetical protein FocTR4_00006162 [Fusarium oxysporum f. sp. cubense]